MIPIRENLNILVLIYVFTTSAALGDTHKVLDEPDIPGEPVVCQIKTVCKHVEKYEKDLQLDNSDNDGADAKQKRYEAISEICQVRVDKSHCSLETVVNFCASLASTEKVKFECKKQ